MPNHYTTAQRVAGILAKFGKDEAAKYIQTKLPKGKKIRSGDLGEILGVSYVTQFTAYKECIHRLRWKDHDEMAMRGDDIIAIWPVTSPEKIKFLKGEVKSAASLNTATVKNARTALLKDNGRPAPHALTFLADQLHAQKQSEVANLIDAAVLRDGIKENQILHFIFTVSGNDPTTFLSADLINYKGVIQQKSVGIMVWEHQKFIQNVYEKVIKNGIDN